MARQKSTLLFLCVCVLFVAGLPDSRTVRAQGLEASLSTSILGDGEALHQVQEFLLARIPGLQEYSDRDACLDDLAVRRERVLEEVVFRGWPEEVVKRRVGKDAVRRLDDQTIVHAGSGYRVRKLLYEPYPGLWLPALLYEPEKLEGKVPVVLNPNGHERGLGKAAPYKQLRCINLAKRGFLALSPEWFAMGELRRPGYDHNQIACLDLTGRSGLALFYLALRGALDVLLDHPHSDPKRVAVTGLSGGGWQTILFSALDQRVTACAPNAGYIGLASRVKHAADIGDLEQCPTDLVSIADYTHLTAMLLPRPALLIYNQRDNCCFPSARAKPSVYDPVHALYKRFAAHAEFSYHENVAPGTHNYDLDNREALYRFLNGCFLESGEARNRELPCDGEILSYAQLAVGLPSDNATFHSIAVEALGAVKPVADPRVALRDVLRLDACTVRKGTATALPDGRAHRLSLSTGWTLPVVELTSKGQKKPKGVTLLLADGGRAELASAARDWLGKDRVVLCADVAFHGELATEKIRSWALAMMMASVGRRPLGEQVAQVLALARWAREKFGVPLTVYARGKVVSVAALLATVLDGDKRIDRLLLESSPESLASLIRDDVPYASVPELYCFGLLGVGDLERLITLTDGRARRLP